MANFEQNDPFVTELNTSGSHKNSHNESDTSAMSSPTLFNFGGVLNIQPVDEDNTEYQTVQVNFNGVKKNIRVPVLFLNDNKKATTHSVNAQAPKRKIGNSCGTSSAAQLESATSGSSEKEMINNLFTELEKEVDHHVNYAQKSCDGNIQSLRCDRSYNSTRKNVNQATRSYNADVSFDNVIVIAPDSEKLPQYGVGGRNLPKKSSVPMVKQNIVVTPGRSVLKAPAPNMSAVYNLKTSNRMIVLSSDEPNQRVNVSKVPEHTVMKPFNALAKSPINVDEKNQQTGKNYREVKSMSTVSKTRTQSPVTAVNVAKSGADGPAVLGNDGYIYIHVYSKPPQQPVMPAGAAQSSAPALFIQPAANLKETVRPSFPKKPTASAGDVVVGTSRMVPRGIIPTGNHHSETISELLPKTSPPRSCITSCKNFETPNTTSAVSSDSNSATELRISSVRSLRPEVFTATSGKQCPLERERVPCKKEETGLLFRLLHDIQNAVQEETSDANQKRKDNNVVPSVGSREDPSKKQRTSFVRHKPESCEGKLSVSKCEGRRSEPRREGGSVAFKENPVLRVVVEKLDLGPRFKSCKYDRLPQYLAYRRRLKRCASYKNTTSGLHELAEKTLGQDGKERIRRDSVSFKDRPTSDESTTKSDTSEGNKIILIKTSFGRYLIPMVPGLTVNGLVQSLQKGTLNLPPVKPGKSESVSNDRIDKQLLSCNDLKKGRDIKPTAVTASLQSAGSTKTPITADPSQLEPAASWYEERKESASLYIVSSVTGVTPVYETNVNTSEEVSILDGSTKSLSPLKRSASGELGITVNKRLKEDINQNHYTENSNSLLHAQLCDELEHTEKHPGAAVPLSSSDRIKLLKEKLKQQEAALQKARKLRLKTTQFLKEVG